LQLQWPVKLTAYFEQNTSAKEPEDYRILLKSQQLLPIHYRFAEEAR